MIDLFTAPPRGMVRVPDHSTSERAAVKVKRRTLRQMVLHVFQMPMHGMTDEALDDACREIDPVKGRAESSYRKRRTELTDEGYLIDTGTTRKNRHGNDQAVFIHRKFHPAPPPIKVKAKGSRAQAMAARRQSVLMFNALVMAAPHHQGGKSEVGMAIADALGIPFPITYSNIPALKPV